MLKNIEKILNSSKLSARRFHFPIRKTLSKQRLSAYEHYVADRKRGEMGYPVNFDIKLTKFYKWYLRSNACNTLANNAGDPFGAAKNFLNTLSFEREVIEFFAPRYGFDLDNLWGVVTCSGTDGNNHGIYFGVKYLEKKTQKKPVVYVSDAAHYSIIRIADLQNLDLVVVPSDEHGCMKPAELEKMLIKDRPALVVFALGTTFKGGVDNQEVLNAVLAKYPSVLVYRHIDAALFGGYLPYTDYRDVVNRKKQPFDSIAISGHKFFGMDEPAGIFLTTKEIKDNQNPYNITYLNGSMPMINCSRSAISPLKLWWLITYTGEKGFRNQAQKILRGAVWLKEELDKMNYPSWREPMSNIVYFKRPSQVIIDKYSLSLEYDERLGGGLSHIVVMQHVNRKHLKNFLRDLSCDISRPYAKTSD